MSVSVPSVKARLGLARWRLRTHHLTDATVSDPEAVVDRLLGVQAENQSQAMWAVATRTTEPDLGRLSGLLQDGRIVRTHVLRPTWHFVRADDLGWLGDLCRPRLRVLVERQLMQLGVDHPACSRAIAVIAGAVAGCARTRRELMADLAESGLAFDGQQLMLVAAAAEIDEVICSGPLRDGTHTYTSFRDRVPSTRRLDRDAALAELALRYITGHGPATDRDLAYWATLSLGDARSGLAAVADQLGSVEVDDIRYWYRGDPPERSSAIASANLLQILDEYYRGYQHTRGLLDVAQRVPRGRETSTGMVLIDAQIVAGMTRTVGTDRVVFEIRGLRALSRTDKSLIDATARRYGSFLDLAATVTYSG